MFIDQEEKAHPVRKWVMRLLKLSFILSAIVLVFVTILANMGGSSQMLKESAERFVSESFGGKPTLIQTLVRLSFFPLVGVDVEKLQVTEPSVPGSMQKAEVVAVFSKIKFFTDFWDVVFGNSRFRTLLIEDGFVKKNVIGEKSLTLERAYVDHDDAKGEAFIRANGLYDKNEWMLEVGVDVRNSFGKQEYEIGVRTPFKLRIEDVNISGDVLKDDESFMKVEKLRIEQGGIVLQGELFMSLISPSVIKIRGNFAVRAGQVRNFDFDILMNFKEEIPQMSGDITGENFAMSDLFGPKSVHALNRRLYELLRERPLLNSNKEFLSWVLESANVDLNFDLKDVTVSNVQKATWMMRYKQKNGNLELENVKGMVGTSPFDIPSLALVRKGEEFFAFVDSKVYTPKVFSLVQDKMPQGLPAEENADAGCFALPVFTSDIPFDAALSKTPIALPLAQYTFLTSVFDDPSQKDCLSLVAQEKP